MKAWYLAADTGRELKSLLACIYKIPQANRCYIHSLGDRWPFPRRFVFGMPTKQPVFAISHLASRHAPQGEVRVACGLRDPENYDYLPGELYRYAPMEDRKASATDWL